VNADIPSDIHDRNKGLSAQVDYRFNGYTLTSITAVRDWDNTQYTSTSAIGNAAEVARITAAFPATRDIGTVDFSQASQELRLASPKDQFWNMWPVPTTCMARTAKPISASSTTARR
jgi:iron complex outermembrane receptor protein